jgi:signal peptidase I
MRAARRARAAVVRGGAAALGLALVALLAVTLGALAVKSTGHQLLVVTSGSMEPYFSAGDALVVERLDDAERAQVQVGDVVTFRPLSGGGLVTHRVAALRTVDGVPFVQTRGDANPVPDPDLAPLSNLVAHTQVVLPGAGRAAVVLDDQRLRAWLYGLPMLVVMAWSLRDLLGSGGLLRAPLAYGPVPLAPRRRSSAGGGPRVGLSARGARPALALDTRRPALMASVGLLAVSLVGIGLAPSRALFQDTAASAANTFGTAAWTANTVVTRVNTGGAGVAVPGPDWVQDTAAAPYSGLLNPANSNTYATTATINMTDPSVPAGTPQAVFQNERWDPAGGTPMTYQFTGLTAPVKRVRLYFADIYGPTMAPGARVFDVFVNGVLVLDNFDVYVAAGNAGDKGITRTFAALPQAGVITVSFDHVVENPAIKGIEILR